MPAFALPGLSFEQPAYLFLLVVIPLLIAVSFRSLSGLGSIRRTLAIVIRCAVVALMVLALAGAVVIRTNDFVSVIFLLDRSHSIPRDVQRDGFEFIREAQAGLKPDDSLGVIAFDGVSAVEQMPQGALAIERVTEPVRPDQTNIAGAMRLGMALFPPSAARRMVLISDGNENVGEAMKEVQQLRAAGIAVDVLPQVYEHANEVVFEQLKVPPSASAHETIQVQMVLRSQRPVNGKILLYHNDQLLDLDPGPGAGYAVKLPAGPERFAVPVPLRAAGVHRFRATFEPDDAAADSVAENNEGRGFTIVSGQGTILILTTEEDLREAVPSARVLQQALERELLPCSVEVAGAQPLDQVRLLEYGLVILSNVPANYIRDEDQRALAAYVRDLGGGLIMVGGDESFGAGGWLGSPVEEVMPVSFDVKNKKQMPKGALALVMHACEIPEGNYWGERVAIAAVKTLSSRDLVGVLSYQWFNAERGYWVVPLQEVGDKTGVIQQILRMKMGDMPDLHEVMAPAVEALIARKDAAARHMVVISDFDPTAPTQALIDRMKKNRVTCSTVAIGYGGHMIDESKANWIATQTGGRFYKTDDYSQLPQIFIKESKVVRRSLIQEVTFEPRLTTSLATTVAGLQGEAVPALNGYVLTTPRPLAEVPLIRRTQDGDDPILAHWQVGLGRTAVFTSGLWPRWGADWAAWPKFSKFWAQLCRWASRQSGAAPFDISTSFQGGRGRVRIDALDKNASAIDVLEMTGALVDPTQETRPLDLTQVGPGRFEATFDARERGNYIVSVAYRMGAGKDAQHGTLRTGVSIAYSPEFRDLSANLPWLNELRQVAGGRELSRADAARVFDRGSLPRVQARSPIWEVLVRWLLLLFLLDVAVRRVAIHPIELARKLRRRIAEMAGSRKPAEASEAVLASLKGAKGRAREERGGGEAAGPTGEAGPTPDRSAKYEAPKTASQAFKDLSEALGGAAGDTPDRPVVAPPTGQKPPATEADYTSRLLRAKKRARDEQPRDQKDSNP